MQPLLPACATAPVALSDAGMGQHNFLQTYKFGLFAHTCRAAHICMLHLQAGETLQPLHAGAMDGPMPPALVYTERGAACTFCIITHFR